MDELKRLMKAAQITEQLCVDYVELGAEDNRRLCAFLMEGDKDDGIIVCVDEEPTGTDVPSPRLEFIAAAVNALPELLALREENERLRRLEGALKAIAKEQSATTATEAADRMQFIARAALKETDNG